MCGGMRSFELRGIIPRTITAIFAAIEDRPAMSYSVRVSYTEIYSEFMYDLLAQSSVERDSGTELQVGHTGCNLFLLSAFNTE